MPRIAHCKSCGAEIIWIETEGGKMMPCDATQETYWLGGGKDRIVTPNGEVLSGRFYGEPGKAAGLGYRSHFATCPNADRHRKGKEERA